MPYLDMLLRFGVPVFGCGWVLGGSLPLPLLSAGVTLFLSFPCESALLAPLFFRFFSFFPDAATCQDFFSREAANSCLFPPWGWDDVRRLPSFFPQPKSLCAPGSPSSPDPPFPPTRVRMVLKSEVFSFPVSARITV